MVARAQEEIYGLYVLLTTGEGYGTLTVCLAFFQWGVAGPAVSTEVTDQKEAWWIWAEQCVSPGSCVSHVSTWEY